MLDTATAAPANTKGTTPTMSNIDDIINTPGHQRLMSVLLTGTCDVCLLRWDTETGCLCDQPMAQLVLPAPNGISVAARRHYNAMKLAELTGQQHLVSGHFAAYVVAKGYPAISYEAAASTVGLTV